jgi:hypothetical protein
MAERMLSKDWLVPVVDHVTAEAVRKLQKKVLELDRKINGAEPNEAVRDGEEGAVQVAPNRWKCPGEEMLPDVPLYDENGNPRRLYFVLRGKFNPKKNDFFRGFVSRDEYVKEQAGAWNFVGNSSTKPGKLCDWILKHQPDVDRQNKTFYNPEEVFSKKWYSIVHPDGNWWVVSTPLEIEEIKEDRPEMKRCQALAHNSYKAAREHVIKQANDEPFRYM